MKKKIAVILLVFVSLILGCLVNAYLINPGQVNIRKEEITSDKIPEEFDDFIIAYFSDAHIQYDLSNLKKAVENIDSFSPDVILFGGDLIHDDFVSQEELIELLSELSAPYGKYAVLGDEDKSTERKEEEVREILEKSGFKVLCNESIPIYLNRDAFITITGIEPIINGSPDSESAFSNVSYSEYSFVLCHTPDYFSDLPAYRCDYMLSGHSLGGQIYLPLISYFNRPDGARDYFRGKTSKDGVILDITNGIGTENKKARLLADSEVVIYRITASS